jgi:hypothetical protein
MKNLLKLNIINNQLIRGYSSIPSSEASIAGTVKHYKHHLLVHTNESNWPKRAFETNQLTKELFRKLSLNPSQLMKESKLNFIKDSEMQDDQNTRINLSILPLGLKFNNLTLENIDHWIDSVAKNRLNFNNIKEENGWKIERISYDKVGLVCTHNEVDCRCGTTGVQIFDRLSELIKQNNLNYKLYKCSHIGGHKYAGNLVSYPDGHWYGNLNANNINEFFESWTQGGLMVDNWRGNHNFSGEEQLKFISQYQ